VTRHDVVTERLIAEYRATLAGYLFDADPIPPGFHFGLAPAIPSPSDLGPDGAERKGLFLPSIPFARRMWAGGRIDIFAQLREQQQIVRRSTISSIDYREGRAGAFYLVSILHEIEADGALALRDRQDLVFREGGRAAVGKPSAPPGADSWAVEATAALLFRFSAFTFNGHRIHYDLDFARNEEGYEGLLVHGPLQAALLLNRAAAKLGHVPGSFEYRCLAPLTSGQTFHVDGGNDAACRIIDARGVTTSEGRVPETA
jgi:3-methylfumaryl-CoA hydratase